MYVKVLSTRHTKIGTLRFGMILQPDMKNDNVASVINALLKVKPSPIKKLSKKEAEEEKAAVASLVAEATKPDAGEGPEKVIAELMDGLKAAETALSDEAVKLEAAQADVEALKAGKLEVEQSLKEKEVALNVALGKVEALQQELDAVIMPTGKGAGAAK